jgi:hypothetical protein
MQVRLRSSAAPSGHASRSPIYELLFSRTNASDNPGDRVPTTWEFIQVLAVVCSVTVIIWVNHRHKTATQFPKRSRAFPNVFTRRQLHYIRQWCPKCRIHGGFRRNGFVVGSGDDSGDADQQLHSKEFS